MEERLHVLETRKEVSKYKKNNYYKSSIIAFEKNTKDLSRIEKARWFRVSRNNKLANFLIRESWDKFREIYKQGYRSIIGLRKDTNQWVEIHLSDDRNYGLSMHTTIFDIDSFNFTDLKRDNLKYIDDNIITKYYENQNKSEKLYAACNRISKYLYDCIVLKYRALLWDPSNRNIKYFRITINNRLYVFQKDGLHPIMEPEDQGSRYLDFKID